MEAKKLRIGNLVQLQPTALHYDGRYSDTIFEISELKEDVVHFKGFDTGEYYKDLKAIELNDGWLKLYGFDVEYTNGGFLRWQREDFKLLDRRLPYPATNYHKNHITKLHQLQNLFFELMGTELELNHKSSACS